MLKYMLDTNIVIFTIKNKPAHMQALFNQHSARLCISSVTLMELLYGAEKSANPEKNLAIVEGFAARVKVLDYGREAAAHTGQIRAELAKAGTPIGAYDLMIAGHARSRGFVVVTNNTREFQRVAGLMFEDWTQEDSDS
ncbi:MAG: type II toxin-antitoxin system tRNA(fMet)-specific endonuclease VapC [Shewanella sp.]